MSGCSPSAAGEETFRVMALTLKPPSSSRKRTTLPPCDPVAPVTAITGFEDISIVEWGDWLKVGWNVRLVGMAGGKGICSQGSWYPSLINDRSSARGKAAPARTQMNKPSVRLLCLFP